MKNKIPPPQNLMKCAARTNGYSHWNWRVILMEDMLIPSGRQIQFLSRPMSQPCSMQWESIGNNQRSGPCKVRALYIQTEEFKKKMNVCRNITYWVGLFCIGVRLGHGVGIAVRFSTKAGTFFFSTAPRWALESTKPHIQWVLVLLIRDEKAGAWSSQLCPA